MKKAVITRAALNRRRSEASTSKGSVGKNRTAAAKRDPMRLLHELRVHQIELEAQNEQLRRAQQELDTVLFLRRRLPRKYFCRDSGFPWVVHRKDCVKVHPFHRLQFEEIFGRSISMETHQQVSGDEHSTFEEAKGLKETWMIQESDQNSSWTTANVFCAHQRLIDDVMTRSGKRSGKVRCLECLTIFDDPFQGLK